MPFYERPGQLRLCRVLGLLAGALLLASLFFRWRAVHVKADIRVREGFSLFEVIRHAFVKGVTDSSWLRLLMVLLGLLILASGVWMIYFGFRDQFGKKFLREDSLPERFFARFRLISHVIPAVLPVVAAVSLEHTVFYRILYERMNETYLSWQSLMLKGYHDWKLPGLGCVFFYLGIAMYIFAEGYRYLIETLNEAD